MASSIAFGSRPPTLPDEKGALVVFVFPQPVNQRVVFGTEEPAIRLLPLEEEDWCPIQGELTQQEWAHYCHLWAASAARVVC